VKGEDSPEASITPSTVPYVPATVKNDPMTITKTLKQTIGSQLLELYLPLAQLSYSHMPPYGWKQRIVPRSAPISEVRASKPGIVLEMMYAMVVIPPVQHSQQIQCVGVLRFK
jgi:hypothetical protein